MLGEALNLGGRGEALRLLECLELGLRFDVEQVRERGEGAFLGVVEETALLKEEGEVQLSAHVVAH